MVVGFDLFEDVLDFAVGANDERGPGYSHDLLAIHVLFFHDAEGICDLLFGIGEQGKGQILLFLKFLLCFWGIRGYAKQHGARLLNLSICVAEPASLHGSTGGICPRIKEQNYRLAPQIFERDFGAVLVLQSEVGSFIINFHAKFSNQVEMD